MTPLPGRGPATLLDKLWDAHVVPCDLGGPDLLYVDLHLVQEVSSPQAFAELRERRLRVRRPDLTVATADHAVPTSDRGERVRDPVARLQLQTLSDNCREFGIELYDLSHERQGIVHVIGPELGLTQPGMSIVCGDSHTSTHGAFGALAFGIGTSETAHVLATQCLPQRRPRALLLQLDGRLGPAITAKDLALGLIARLGADGAAGHAIEYRGEVVSRLSMESRMTLCNMSIEAGARIGLVAPDRVTVDYLHGRPFLRADEDTMSGWLRLASDPDARFDAVRRFDVSDFAPVVTWGTSPAMSVSVEGRVPSPAETEDEAAAGRALAYMGLRGGEAVTDLRLDRVFIGSCTNGRIEDLREAAAVVRGRRVAAGVTAMVVPGSGAVGRQAEQEGLADVFRSAGFSWRDAGCSLCVAMNDDRLRPGERCASTSNRNFEGRQGPGGRTHLVSPAMAAAAALVGHFVDVRELAADRTQPSNDGGPTR